MVLVAEMNAAKMRHERARVVFSSVDDKISAGLHPPATQLVRNQASEDRDTAEAWRRALQRFTDFVARGVVPDDLKPQAKAAAFRPLAPPPWSVNQNAIV